MNLVTEEMISKNNFCEGMKGKLVYNCDQLLHRQITKNEYWVMLSKSISEVYEEAYQKGCRNALEGSKAS
jgi:hypothetical protein